MDDSILISIKKLLGIDKDYKIFDQDILVLINTAFSTLIQLDVPSKTVTSEEEKWSEVFAENADLINMIKTYTYLSVRITFDPPTSSFVMESLNKTRAELEWRINVQAEGGFKNEDESQSS